MAKETKSLSVAPSAEASTIEIYQIFGWELMSSQEIYNKDSHLEDRGGDTYSVTETTHYIKLVFSRDTNMDNYYELTDLERKYWSITYPKKPSSAGLFILSILGIGGGFALSAEIGVPGILISVVGIAVFVLACINKSKKTKQYNEECNLCAKKEREILSKAKTLLK